jgi:hypothetical protein
MVRKKSILAFFLFGCVISSVFFVHLIAQTEVVEVEIIPSEKILYAGEKFKFKAIAKDTYGKEVPNIEIEWSVQYGLAGTIDKNGIFTAKENITVRQEDRVIAKAIAYPNSKAGIAKIIVLPKAEESILPWVALGICIFIVVCIVSYLAYRFVKARRIARAEAAEKVPKVIGGIPLELEPTMQKPEAPKPAKTEKVSVKYIRKLPFGTGKKVKPKPKVKPVRRKKS